MVHNVPAIFTTEFAHKCHFSAMLCFGTLSMPRSFTRYFIDLTLNTTLDLSR